MTITLIVTTLSTLNKRINYSNTAIWTNPIFNLGKFYQNYCKIPQTLFMFSIRPDLDQRAPIGALWSGSKLFENEILNSLQQATRLKGLMMVSHIYRALDKSLQSTLLILFLQTNSMFDHLLESSWKDGSNKWSNTGFRNKNTHVQALSGAPIFL